MHNTPDKYEKVTRFSSLDPEFMPLNPDKLSTENGPFLKVKRSSKRIHVKNYSTAL